mmetsp:Transcript_12712/g.41925  ORF Transcript_12712/g.41925 Transcript_12712/m.41925 type:complete len:112 (+) Transcript_12712:2551-2886(+)
MMKGSASSSRVVDIFSGLLVAGHVVIIIVEMLRGQSEPLSLMPLNYRAMLLPRGELRLELDVKLSITPRCFWQAGSCFRFCRSSAVAVCRLAVRKGKLRRNIHANRLDPAH